MRIVLAVVLSLSMTACSTIDRNEKDSIPNDLLTREQRQVDLTGMINWGLRGRISVKSGTKGVNASLVWKQSLQQYEMRLSGSLGFGGIRITQTPDEAVIYQNGDKPLYGLLADELLLWETGLNIPLRSLRFWLKGLPGDGHQVEYDQYGRMRSLLYVDAYDIIWKADFDRYRLVGGRQLPVRIRVEGDGFLIKLTTDQWDVEAPLQQQAPVRFSIPGASS